MTMDKYASALDVPGLDFACALPLAEHILSRNQELVDRSPAPLAVARCAAALMAADEKLPSPMALAQAEVLAQIPEVGPALMNIQGNLMTITQQLGGTSDEVGFPREAAMRVLRHLIEDGTRLMTILN
jgi:hypothetical protein